MVDIGRVNTLTVKRKSDGGAQLDGGELGDVFLQKKFLPKNCSPGTKVEVFVYVDKDEKLQATTQKPLASVGQFARLSVVSTSPAGAFLDWGLPKDLLVPKKEQQVPMEEGRAYVVFVFLDHETNRIAASSKLNKYLGLQSPNYQEGEEVDLLICEKTDLGYKAIVNNSQWGVLYENEVFQQLNPGQRLKGYIKTVREDLKIDLTLQKSGYKRVDEVSQRILEKIKDLGGSMAVTGKSPPDDIYSMFGVSKKTFKMAIGALYKKRLIVVSAEAISLSQLSE